MFGDPSGMAPEKHKGGWDVLLGEDSDSQKKCEMYEGFALRSTPIEKVVVTAERIYMLPINNNSIVQNAGGGGSGSSGSAEWAVNQVSIYIAADDSYFDKRMQYGVSDMSLLDWANGLPMINGNGVPQKKSDDGGQNGRGNSNAQATAATPVPVKIWFMIDYEGAMGFGHMANALELPDGFHLFSKNGAGEHGNKLWGQSYSPQVGTFETFSLFENKVDFVLNGSLKYDAVFVVTVSSSPENLDILINSLTNQVLSDYKIDADACPHTSVYISEWLNGEVPGSGIFSHALRIPSIYYNILWSNLSEDGFKITPIYNLGKVRKAWKLIKQQRSIN